jgi:glycosyltransferase involved in cell wall biosynthesis
MLSGESILCFTPGPWRDMWRSRHQIMLRLARSNKVLWVEPRLSLRETRRALQRPGLRWLPQAERVAEGLCVMHNPALLPASGPAPLRSAANGLYDHVVQRTMAGFGMSPPILWLYLPEMAGIIGRYNERLVVYHVIDEYTAYAGMPAQYLPVLRAQEERLLRRADVVVVTAPALLESKRQFSDNVYLVPNAVDFAGFRQTLAKPTVPEDMRALAQPVIGYVGAINDKLDYALLAAVAAARPAWTLALVGPVDVKTDSDRQALQALRLRDNVRLIGQVAVADVPLYMAGCRVCLLPYKVNERTRNISSLKIYEYLACGRPVVATDVPAAHEVGKVVSIAPADRFVAAIEQALAGPDGDVARRLEVAQANTWDSRVEAISQIIEEALRKRGARSA